MSRLNSLRRDESGSMLVELLIAMTFIVVAVGALMASYAASMVSLHRSSTEGTALTLADRQIEAYKSLPYASIQLASTTIPASGTDPYNTASSTDSSIPSATGQLTGGTVASSCTSSTDAVTGCATQTWTGPDNQPYRVDTYITAYTPSGGRAIKRITVAVRRMESGSPSTKIWSRATSEFDQSNPPQ